MTEECAWFAGERYSVVLNANRPVGTYWMEVRSTGLCTHMRAYQVAILRYRGGPRNPRSERPAMEETAANRVGLVSDNPDSEHQK